MNGCALSGRAGAFLLQLAACTVLAGGETRAQIEAAPN
jgi:hypothetical protein